MDTWTDAAYLGVMAESHDTGGEDVLEQDDPVATHAGDLGSEQCLLPTEGDQQAEAPTSGEQATEALLQDLGEVESITDLNRKVGNFLDTLAPSPGSYAYAKVQLIVKIPVNGVVGIHLSFEASVRLRHEKNDMYLTGELAFEPKLILHVWFAKLEIGARIGGRLRAKADNGTELMRLMSLGMLPTVRSVNERLASCMYGDQDAFQHSVLTDMDANDPADPSDDDEEDQVTSSVEMGGVGGVQIGESELGLSVSHQDTTRFSKGCGSFGTTETRVIAGS